MRFRTSQKILFIFLVHAVALGCIKPPRIYVQPNTTEINRGIRENKSIQEFIAPYSDSLSREMDEVLGKAEFNIERGRPEGRLGNLVADLTLERALQEGWVKSEENPIVIMNHGGLRSPISAGPVKRGDIFKLMPFDNTIAIITIPKERLSEIANYIHETGGQPISGFRMKGVQIIDSDRFGEVIKVVTTDYLASGGDKMTFFENPVHAEYYPLLLRDIIIDYVHAKKQLAPELDGRIIIE